MPGNDSFTKLLLHFDGLDGAVTTSDSSPSAHGAATFGGTAQLDTAQKKFGVSSLFLDGNSDYITFPYNADFDLMGDNAEDYVLEAVVRFADYTVEQCIFSQYKNATNFWQLRATASHLGFSFAKTGEATIGIVGGNFSANKIWYHVALAKIGTSIKLFVDGVNIGSVTTSLESSLASVLNFGRRGNGSQFFGGHIDEVRISKGIARWTANFTPPTQAYNDAPSKFYVYLKNRSGKLIKVINDKLATLSWRWDRLGGCGQGSVVLIADETWLNDVGPDYEINIYLGGKLRYAGIINSHKPKENKGVNQSVLSFLGYSSQIKRVLVEKTYTSQNLTDILKDILDTFIIPNTDITYDDADIGQFNFVPDILELDTNGGNAIKTLAGLAGSVEYGVDANKKFFFKSTSNIVGFNLKYTKELSNVDIINDYSGIVNRLIILGKDSFKDTANNTESQSAYGLRTQTQSVSSISTTGVAQQFGTSILLEKAAINQKAKFTVEEDSRFYEETLPLQKVKLLARTVIEAKKYGDADAIYGDFAYGGETNYQINKLTYSLQNKKVKTTIEAGFKRPDLAEEIKRIQFEIDQIRSS